MARLGDGGAALMFSRVLIANRGEIAVRIARTCHELGAGVVAVYSDVDAASRHVAVADEAVHLPGVAPAETYLNVDAVIEAARSTGADAVHPGYGFLSERERAAEAVAGAGLVWVGPPPQVLQAAGDKINARRLAQSAGVSPVPGTLEPVTGPDQIRAFGERHGYPVAVKATGGGGGRGLKVAATPDDVPEAFEAAVREAVAYFGSDQVYLERYLVRPKHIEVQIVSPRAGQALALGARDCSLQRRNQKLIEETPPARFTELIPGLEEAACAVADACGYVNAGTVEFLVDAAEARFYFLEINARLQVEHTITEEVSGLDLVAAQLRIAAGEPLGFDRDDLDAGGRAFPRGHAIECRINAEDPGRMFLPRPGRITRYREPGGPGVRVDSGYAEGDDVPASYDSLIAKLVVWGSDRDQARRRMLRALDEFAIEGVATTIPAHRILLEAPAVVDGSYTTGTVEGGILDALAAAPEAGPTRSAVLLVGGRPALLWNPAIAGSVSREGRPAGGGSEGVVVAPMHGTILKVLVAEGDTVEAGDPVAILEAMKMETHVAATTSGKVTTVKVRPGDIVEAGQAVATVRPGSEA